MLSNITTRLFHGIVVQIGYIKNKMLNNLTSQYNPHMSKHNNNITVDRNLRPSMALVCSSVIIS